MNSSGNCIQYICAFQRVTNPIFNLDVLDSSGTCNPSENSTVYMAGEGMSFSSPGFPLHPGNGWCHWNISVSPGNFVKLTFWDIFGPCNSSYVEVYDATNSTWVYLGRFCYLTVLPAAQVVYSRGNSLLVTYVSVSPPSKSPVSGFLATYETLTAVPAAYACSKPSWGDFDRIKLQGTNGELASYQYPMPYSNDVNCSWTIEVPLGYVINFTFHSFDLQQSQDCQEDYVLIKQEKYSWQAGEIVTDAGRFCGSSLPGAIQSNHTKMYVDFVADSSGRYPGFHASYTAVEDRKSMSTHCQRSFEFMCMNHDLHRNKIRNQEIRNNQTGLFWSLL